MTKYPLFAALVLFVFSSCKKVIRYRNKGETITAVTLNNNLDTGRIWIVDSIQHVKYSNWDANYYRPGIGGWRNRIYETYFTSNQFIRFNADFSYSATDSLSKLLGILPSGIYDITYLINMGDTHPEDSSTLSLYLSCSYCDPPALASRVKNGNLQVPNKLYIESSYYEPNPYDGQYFGTAFIRPL